MPRRPTFYVWHIQSKEFVDYACARGFVVTAQTDERARELCYGQAGDELNEHEDYWTNLKHSTCTKLGPSRHRGERVILTDFYEA